MSHRIIFIDSNVAEYQSLIPQLPEDSEVIILGASKDGVIQILEALQGRTEIGAIDIISHGAPGVLMLGSTELSNVNLTAYAEQLTQIGAHLGDTADILLYGCEVAQGRQGQAFIEQLSLLSGANVAASTNLTGAEALGGDWMLEAHTGVIKTNALQLPYSGVLSSNEFKVNTYTDSTQFQPSITGLSNGGFVVSWSSDGQDGDLLGIYAQRYDANGIAQGAEFRVNATTARHQTDPLVTALPNGGFVVNWQSLSSSAWPYDLYARRYDANGVPQGDEFMVNTGGAAEVSSITALSDSGFVVSWNNYGSYGGGIYAQRYDANGVAQSAELKVNSTKDYDQIEPSIAGLSDGGFVVSWTSHADHSYDPYDIHAQRYDANGVAQGAEFRINTTTDDNQEESSISGLSNGGFVVSWTSAGFVDDTFGREIYAQRYDANGVMQGGEFMVNTTTNQTQAYSSISGLSNGGFVVSWMSVISDSSHGSIFSNIYARRYDADGVAQGDEFKVNDSPEDGLRTELSITALADGGFVVGWTSQNGFDTNSADIYAKRYDANGNEVTPPESTGIEPADRLFNWAESTFTDLFPNHAASQEIAGYHARIYENGNALGEQSSNIYFYDGHSITLVGTVDDFLPGAVAAGF